MQQRDEQFFQEQFSNRLEAHLVSPSSGYLFSGPSHVGKKELATLFVKNLLCVNLQKGKRCNQCDSCKIDNIHSHPDFYNLERPEGKDGIVIEQVHNLIGRLKTKPTISTYSVVLITAADRMTTSATNALLKVLEEPQGKTVFILLDNLEKAILSTIRSRCQSFVFKPHAQSELINHLKNIGESEESAKKVSYLAKGRLVLAYKMLSDKKLKIAQDERYAQILDSILTHQNITEALNDDTVTGWSQKQLEALETLEDYKYIWHNILLYALGLDTILKTYHNQKALNSFISNISTSDIAKKIEDIAHSIKAVEQSVPGALLLDSLV